MVILEYLLGHHIFHQHQNFGLPALCLLYVCLTYHRVKTGNYTRLNHGSPKQNRCLICKCCKRCSLDLRQTYPLTSARASCFAKQSKLFNFFSAETFARTSWHRQQVSGSTTNCAIVPKIRQLSRELIILCFEIRANMNPNMRQVRGMDYIRFCHHPQTKK